MDHAFGGGHIASRVLDGFVPCELFAGLCVGTAFIGVQTVFRSMLRTTTSRTDAAADGTIPALSLKPLAGFPCVLEAVPALIPNAR